MRILRAKGPDRLTTVKCPDRLTTVGVGSPYVLGETGRHKYLCEHDIEGDFRMRALMSVIEGGRVDLEPLVTHRFSLDDIEEASERFADRRDGVMTVAVTP